MTDAELATYRQQLTQVNTALESDPDNVDLQSLKESLQSLIDLSTSVVPKSAVLSQSKRGDDSAPKKKIGDRVLARYSGDQSWSEAKVLGVSSNQQRTTYSLEFVRRGVTAVVDAKDIKDMPSNYRPHSKRPLPPSEDISSTATNNHHSSAPSGPVKKKAKREDKFESQTAWQKFTKKQGRRKSSMFATPDEIDGRVGVTGSGKGVTKFAEKKRHEAVGRLEGLEMAAKVKGDPEGRLGGKRRI